MQTYSNLATGIKNPTLSIIATVETSKYLPCKNRKIFNMQKIVFLSPYFYMNSLIKYIILASNNYSPNLQSILNAKTIFYPSPGFFYGAMPAAKSRNQENN